MPMACPLLRRVTFVKSDKSHQKRPLKPMVSKLPLRASLCQAPCPLPRVVQAVCHSPKCGIDFPLTRSAAYPYGGRSTCSYLSEQKRQRSEKLTAIQHFCPGKMRRPIRVAESTLAFPCAARVRGSRDHWSLAAFLSHLSFRWWKESARRRLNKPSA